jgi:hypothetical protein
MRGHERREEEKREKRTGTYRILEGAIKEGECGDAGCLVTERAWELSPRLSRSTLWPAWPLQLPDWFRQKTIDRQDAQG